MSSGTRASSGGERQSMVGFHNQNDSERLCNVTRSIRKGKSPCNIVSRPCAINPQAAGMLPYEAVSPVMDKCLKNTRDPFQVSTSGDLPGFDARVVS
nr:hypothetical protein CFP56_43902 [Quercus suber]